MKFKLGSHYDSHFLLIRFTKTKDVILSAMRDGVGNRLFPAQLVEV